MSLLKPLICRPEATLRLRKTTARVTGARLRRSALDFLGGMQSMSLSQLSAILAVTARPLSADFAGARFVQLYLYAHRVEGLESGVYRLWPERAELEQIAAFDSLSGLLNRRSLFTRIAIEIERAIRLDVPLTGLMIDIDKFKGINDNYGHQCGDMVIREIGARLLAGLRKYDYAGRYGGEEFYVVLSNSTEQQAFGIAERFRKDMEEMRFQCGGDSIGVTVSIGVARYSPGESQESWIERVDRAMYQAKQSGRNRIVLD